MCENYAKTPEIHTHLHFFPPPPLSFPTTFFRYYGLSKPFPPEVMASDPPSAMKWLTTEQAMADYAELISELQEELGPGLPVVGFGGSYGAGSSPMLSFLSSSRALVDRICFLMCGLGLALPFFGPLSLFLFFLSLLLLTVRLFFNQD